MKKAVIIIPTYNESENIVKLIRAVLAQQKKIKDFQLSILIVDDSSPDGTADLVLRLKKKHKCVNLLLRKNKEGLGSAYIAGLQYAIDKLHADVLIQMDADFSHSPNDIPRLLKAINKNNDFIIGSRYIEGGAIPQDWAFLRKVNSRVGNLVAKYIAGLSVKDCTGGFRAIKSEVIRSINLDEVGVKGYVFQVSILKEALLASANVKEIPIVFKDRQKGKSKIGISDILEFIFSVLKIRIKLILKPLRGERHSSLVINQSQTN